MADKQIDFPPLQKEVSWLAPAMLGLSLLCIVVVVMVVSFWGFVVLENRKLSRQAAKLRASGALDRPTTPTSGPAA